MLAPPTREAGAVAKTEKKELWCTGCRKWVEVNHEATTCPTCGQALTQEQTGMQ